MRVKGLTKGFFILILLIVTLAFFDDSPLTIPLSCGQLSWR